MAAFEAALALGVGIELDLQPSADGVAMAFHDSVLDRLTGETGPVSARNADDLSQIALKETARTIPRLRDVLDLVAGRVPLLVEIKDQDGDMGPDIGRLETDLIDALDGYGGDVAVMSFNPHSMIHMARHAPDLPRGLVTSAFDPRYWPELSAATRDRLRGMPDLAAADASFISHEAAALAMPEVAAAKAAGLSVLCWTVRSKAQEAEALKIADQVTFEGYLP